MNNNHFFRKYTFKISFLIIPCSVPAKFLVHRVGEMAIIRFGQFGFLIQNVEYTVVFTLDQIWNTKKSWRLYMSSQGEEQTWTVIEWEEFMRVKKKVWTLAIDNHNIVSSQITDNIDLAGRRKDMNCEWIRRIYESDPKKVWNIAHRLIQPYHCVITDNIFLLYHYYD